MNILNCWIIIMLRELCGIIKGMGLAELSVGFG